YQSRHVYVDELTDALVEGTGSFASFRVNQELEATNSAPQDNSNTIAQMEVEYEAMPKTRTNEPELITASVGLSQLDSPPAYRTKWNLATDTNLEAGVIYMAQMNPREPACFSMLGVVAWNNRDYNLAVAAFQKAIDLGSPQTEILKLKNADLADHIRG